MIEVLTQRPDLYAVLDVNYPEPPHPESPFYSLPKVLLTPHIVGSVGLSRVLADGAVYDRGVAALPGGGSSVLGISEVQGRVIAYGMMIPGLVSVTFRQLTPEEVIALVERAELQAIEWGEDVHVPHGNLARAKAVREVMRAAGLQTVAYGSYYRVGESKDEDLPFERVLEVALELGAPTIRVWAGTKSSAEADQTYRERVIDDSLRIADLAASVGVKVSYEYHGHTLTDTNASAHALLKEASHDNLYTFWQPSHEMSVEERAEGLECILPRLTNVHIFHWRKPKDRRPFEEGEEGWRRYIEIIRESPKDHPMLLEFVRGDDPDMFLRDAATLKRWLSE